jgi:hypothetical protein
MRFSKSQAGGLILGLFFCFSVAHAEQAAQVQARITASIDPAKRVTLGGNTHPLARPEYDRGAAPDQQILERMLLVLGRAPEQEAALRQLLDEQQAKSSPHYHGWLTPQEFGAQFGPADSDVQTVTGWLESQGFQVTRVAAGRTVIEFSGSAGQIRDAFRTGIHKFAVNGGEYWANAGDPQIPAALAPVVKGFASLNNFPRKHFTRSLGTFRRFKTGGLTPLFTFSSMGGFLFAVGPTDFATIYNVLPLWKGGTNGSGQTIAIVGESNINIADATAFRTLFGLPANNPQVVLDGPDPGLVSGDETEADTDVQWSGAVAENATIKLVVSESTETTAGIDLSALYIIDNNLAPVMSESYGDCEAAIGASGNAFYSSLFEQGAAEGITLVIATGDQGSAACDEGTGQLGAMFGLAVSGVASTPFGVAMGGTDFNDVNNAPTYWNMTNSSGNEASAKSYIPETAWNNSCAQSGLMACSSLTALASDGSDLQGGGGGPSTCSSLNAAGDCIGGYTKPTWQAGAGVPNDHVRDLPDLAMFAGNGVNGSFYVVCEADANGTSATSCDLNPPYTDFQGLGGTSVPTPAFAGIMALVNQKTGERQGNANYVLYKLAAQSGASCASSSSAVGDSSCVFYDVVTGNNSVACLGGTPNCSNAVTNGFGALVSSSSSTTPAWTTTAGYDLATGLGSVNANNLVNNWKSVSFTPSTTTLSLSPATITHGQPVNFTINVTGASGTPTGAAGLEGSPANSAYGITSLVLGGGAASGTTNLLPGGTYTVSAHYSGDGTYGSSDSTPPISVTVSKESSKTTAALVTFDLGGNVTSTTATSASYGSPYVLRSNVTNGAGQGCAVTAVACPTGQVTLTDSGKPLDLGTYALNSQGYFEDQLIQLNAGSHSVTSSYSGDNSFLASSSGAIPMTISKAATTGSLAASPTSLQYGSSVTLTATVTTESNGAAPSGTVSFLNGTKPISGTVTYTGSLGSNGFAQLQAVLTEAPSATENVTASYSGDSNYAASTSPAAQVSVTPGFTLSAAPASVSVASPGASGTSVMTANFGTGFSGPLSFSCAVPSAMQGATCSFSPSSLAGSGTATVTITTVGSGAAWPFSDFPPAGLLLMGVLLLALLVMARRQRWNPAFVLLFCALGAAALVACGGGSSGVQPPPTMVSTPTGMYTIPVTASGASVSHTVNLTVTVQ